MRLYLAICDEWRLRPPAHWLLAAGSNRKPYRAPYRAGSPFSGTGSNDIHIIRLKPTHPRSPEAQARLDKIIADARARGEPVAGDPIPTSTGDQGDDGVIHGAGLAALIKSKGGSWQG